jgi:hypothetical protein
MALRFLCIDPGTNGGNCPALQLDEETGDLVVTGKRETDKENLDHVAATSGIGADEVVIRLPARMRKIILEALRDAGDDDA